MTVDQVWRGKKVPHKPETEHRKNRINNENCANQFANQKQNWKQKKAAKNVYRNYFKSKKVIYLFKKSELTKKEKY